MKADDSRPAPVLTIKGVQFNSLPGRWLDVELRPGESKAIVLPDDELSQLDAMISGEQTPAPGEVTLCGRDPAADGVWSAHLSGEVARTFSPLFGYACWLENLDVDENILLASTMRGERPAATKERALKLARSFGLAALPVTRRAATSPETLAICQWIRAFLVDGASVFLMIDALRNAPESAIKPLMQESKARRAKGAAFLWLLPMGRRLHATTLGADDVIEPDAAEPGNSSPKA